VPQPTTTTAQPRIVIIGIKSNCSGDSKTLSPILLHIPGGSFSPRFSSINPFNCTCLSFPLSDCNPTIKCINKLEILYKWKLLTCQKSDFRHSNLRTQFHSSLVEKIVLAHQFLRLKNETSRKYQQQYPCLNAVKPLKCVEYLRMGSSATISPSPSVPLSKKSLIKLLQKKLEVS